MRTVRLVALGESREFMVDADERLVEGDTLVVDDVPLLIVSIEFTGDDPRGALLHVVSRDSPLWQQFDYEILFGRGRIVRAEIVNC